MARDRPSAVLGGITVLFAGEICGWDSWGRVYQSIPLFLPVIQEIFRREGLAFVQPRHCTPGTNAVFLVGELVIKIYAPKESGLDGALSFSQMQGVPVPKVLACGVVQDRYAFFYLVLSRLEGEELGICLPSMSDLEKYQIGRQLRSITRRMNQPFPQFPSSDVIWDRARWKRWQSYPASFQQEREAYLSRLSSGPRVFVHGDLNGDNVFLGKAGGLSLLDFADAVLAPEEYEHELVACELFGFDSACLEGYFGAVPYKELAQLCLDGLLIHDFGGDVLAQRLCPAQELTGLDLLYDKLLRALKQGGPKRQKIPSK